MNFYELYRELDKMIPKSLSCEWDNDGIMCADDMLSDVQKVLISLDVTSNTVEYAKSNGFDTIISHHPLVFHPQKSLSSFDGTQRKLINLIKSGIRVASFHTRLDAVSGGVNDTLVALLGYKNLEVDSLEPIGRIVTLDKKLSLSTFAENIKAKLGSPFVLFSGDKDVSRVYVVGGDGKDMIQRAISCNADTLLTGRASYNTSEDACDIGLNIVEAGHFYTENPVCNTLSDIVKRLDKNIYTEIYNSNEINFI